MKFIKFINPDSIKNNIVKALNIGDENQAQKIINKSASKLSPEAFGFVIKASVENKRTGSFESLLSSRNLDENLILKVANYSLESNHTEMFKTFLDKTINNLSNETKLDLLEMTITKNRLDGVERLLNNIHNISESDFKRFLSYPRVEENYGIISTFIEKSVNKIPHRSNDTMDIYNELFRSAARNGEEHLLKAIIEKVPNKISKESYGEALNLLIQNEQYDKLYLFNAVNHKIPKGDLEQAKIALSFVGKNKNISSEKHAQYIEIAKKAVTNLKITGSKIMAQDSKALKAPKKNKSSADKNLLNRS